MSTTENPAPREKSSMSMEELLALPVAFPVVVAGRAFGIGRTKTHELVRDGRFPCKVLRVGNVYRVTRAELFRALGVQQPSSQAS